MRSDQQDTLDLTTTYGHPHTGWLRLLVVAALALLLISCDGSSPAGPGEDGNPPATGKPTPDEQGEASRQGVGNPSHVLHERLADPQHARELLVRLLDSGPSGMGSDSKRRFRVPIFREGRPDPVMVEVTFDEPIQPRDLEHLSRALRHLGEAARAVPI